MNNTTMDYITVITDVNPLIAKISLLIQLLANND
jgi:hypothetical protein